MLKPNATSVPAPQRLDIEPLHPIQVRRFREMTLAEKWNVALGLLRTARETRRAALRNRHLEWTAAEVESALVQELIRARA